MSTALPESPSSVPVPSAADSTATVFAWVALCFGSIPVLMWLHGDGKLYGVTGAILMATAAVLFIVGRVKRP